MPSRCCERQIPDPRWDARNAVRGVTSVPPADFLASLLQWSPRFEKELVTKGLSSGTRWKWAPLTSPVREMKNEFQDTARRRCRRRLHRAPRMLGAGPLRAALCPAQEQRRTRQPAKASGTKRLSFSMLLGPFDWLVGVRAARSLMPTRPKLTRTPSTGRPQSTPERISES
jgi:hypothetical protein